MAVSTIEFGAINSAVSSLIHSVAGLNEQARYGVRKAYSDKEDNGAFCQTLFNATPDKHKAELASFFRRQGLNVVRDGWKDTKSIIGGVINQSRQKTVIDRLPMENALALTVKPKREVIKKDPEGTWAEQADDEIKKLIARTKKERPEVAGLINQRFQAAAPQRVEVEVVTPLTFVDQDGVVADLSIEEVRFIRDWLISRELTVELAANA
jgi:hypothetical protein